MAAGLNFSRLEYYSQTLNSLSDSLNICLKEASERLAAFNLRVSFGLTGNEVRYPLSECGIEVRRDGQEPRLIFSLEDQNEFNQLDGVLQSLEKELIQSRDGGDIEVVYKGSFLGFGKLESDWQLVRRRGQGLLGLTTERRLDCRWESVDDNSILSSGRSERMAAVKILPSFLSGFETKVGALVADMETTIQDLSSGRDETSSGSADSYADETKQALAACVKHPLVVEVEGNDRIIDITPETVELPSSCKKLIGIKWQKDKTLITLSARAVDACGFRLNGTYFGVDPELTMSYLMWTLPPKVSATRLAPELARLIDEYISHNQRAVK